MTINIFLQSKDCKTQNAFFLKNSLYTQILKYIPKTKNMKEILRKKLVLKKLMSFILKEETNFLIIMFLVKI